MFCFIKLSFLFLNLAHHSIAPAQQEHITEKRQERVQYSLPIS